MQFSGPKQSNACLQKSSRRPALQTQWQCPLVEKALPCLLVAGSSNERQWYQSRVPLEQSMCISVFPGTQSVQPSQMSSVVRGVMSASFVPTDSSYTGLPNFWAYLSLLLGFT